jgi:hypothetical protein
MHEHLNLTSPIFIPQLGVLQSRLNQVENQRKKSEAFFHSKIGEYEHRLKKNLKEKVDYAFNLF